MHPQKIIEFMSFAESLKNVLRHSYTSAGRHESVAEHSWMLCILAIVCFDAVEVEVDQLRVLKMLIVHDLPEVITGDIPTFDKVDEIAEQAHVAETEALTQIIAPLADHLQVEIMTLFKEYEQATTVEAQFARAIDKAEALIQHNIADISTWDQHDFDYQTNPHHPVVQVFEFDPFMRDLKRQIDHDTMSRIDAAGKHHFAHPDMVWRFRNGDLS